MQNRFPRYMLAIAGLLVITSGPALAQVSPSAPHSPTSQPPPHSRGPADPVQGQMTDSPGVLRLANTVAGGHGDFVDPTVYASCRFITNSHPNGEPILIYLWSLAMWRSFLVGNNGLGPPPGVTTQVCCRPASGTLCNQPNSAGAVTVSVPYTIAGGNAVTSATCTSIYGSTYTDSEVYTCGIAGSGVSADGAWVPGVDNPNCSPLDKIKTACSASCGAGTQNVYDACGNFQATQACNLGACPSCNPAAVANGSVGAYPGCTITCNSGYTLSGGACVAAACNPATVANGTIGAYPGCIVTCNSGYSLQNGACVSSCGTTSCNACRGGSYGGTGSQTCSNSCQSGFTQSCSCTPGSSQILGACTGACNAPTQTVTTLDSCLNKTVSIQSCSASTTLSCGLCDASTNRQSCTDCSGNTYPVACSCSSSVNGSSFQVPTGSCPANQPCSTASITVNTEDACGNVLDSNQQSCYNASACTACTPSGVNTTSLGLCLGGNQTQSTYDSCGRFLGNTTVSCPVNTTCANPSVTNGTVGAWPSCTITCNSGYTLQNGSCVGCYPVSVANGVVAPYPNCAITCNAGYSLSGRSCTANAGTCAAVANGTTSAYPACTVTCNSGYTPSGGGCVQSCTTITVANGTKNSCSGVITCNTGYTLSGGACIASVQSCTPNWQWTPCTGGTSNPGTSTYYDANNCPGSATHAPQACLQTGATEHCIPILDRNFTSCFEADGTPYTAYGCGNAGSGDQPPLCKDVWIVPSGGCPNPQPQNCLISDQASGNPGGGPNVAPCNNGGNPTLVIQYGCGPFSHPSTPQ